MKTAISLPDPLFAQADAAAKKAGLSRSELYARALQAYLAAHAPAEITERLNRVYQNRRSRTDRALAAVARRGLAGEDW